MHLFINIVPQTQLDWPCLTTLIGEITDQHFADITLNLQLPTDQQLTAEQARQADAWSLTQNTHPQLSATDTTLLNLRETDHLLPGALQQWAQVTAQHAGSLVSLATFDSAEPVTAQIASYLADYQDSSTRLTLQQLAGDTPVTDTTTLWALQSYSVQDNLQTQRLLSQRLRLTGLLLPKALLRTDLPLVSLAQTLTVLQNSTDVVRLHVPTLARQAWSATTPLAWLDQLQSITVSDLDVSWQPVFTTYAQNQLNTLLDVAGRRALSASVHLQLLQRIKHLTVQPTRRWSRLGLLQLVSPRMAHRLFY